MYGAPPERIESVWGAYVSDNCNAPKKKRTTIFATHEMEPHEEHLSDFVFIKPLGKGASGVVYLAERREGKEKVRCVNASTPTLR